MRKEKNLWFNNFNLCAKVTYLPYTDVIISLQYLSELDDQSSDLFPHSANLPNNWESFTIQFSDKIYFLPTPLTTFLENG